MFLRFVLIMRFAVFISIAVTLLSTSSISGQVIFAEDDEDPGKIFIIIIIVKI